LQFDTFAIDHCKAGRFAKHLLTNKIEINLHEDFYIFFH
jgi:hypothetical protein